jgi:integrase
MVRPRKDGKDPRPVNKKTLTEVYLQKLQKKPRPRAFLTWDEKQANLAIAAYPSGALSYKVIYSQGGRQRWLNLGKHNAIGLAGARRLAQEIMYRVSKGEDPQAERKARRSLEKFEDLASRYVEEYAKKENRSWKQADALVKRHLVPPLGKLQAHAVTRADVKAALGKIAKPSVANQTLAAASAIFSWAIRAEVGGVKENPCRLIERHESKSRERVLSDSEVPKFWVAFDQAGLIRSMALKVLLLTGQRPGEVCHMRAEHIEDGWWTMPGAPDAVLDWPGTKNGATHRVWLPAPALALIRELHDGELPETGFVFAGPRHGAVGKLDEAMKSAWKSLGAERATPHDLRRTHGTTIAALGFGRDALNRVQNHREGGIASVYDRHEYADENKKVMEATASTIMALVKGGTTGNVITATFPRL